MEKKYLETAAINLLLTPQTRSLSPHFSVGKGVEEVLVEDINLLLNVKSVAYKEGSEALCDNVCTLVVGGVMNGVTNAESTSSLA